MRTKYLVALEEDRFDQLPGRTYARTFLRTYAAALDLDADLFVAEFDEQHPEPDPGPQPAPRRVSLGRLPLSAAATVAAAALVAVIAAWSEWSAQRPAQPAAASAAAPPAAPVSTPRVAPKHVAAERKTVTRPSALVVRAVGGPCWILARRDGPNGPLLAERTLQQGQTARFDVTRVWLRLGAPWNVVVQRGSHRVRGLPAGVPANVIA